MVVSGFIQTGAKAQKGQPAFAPGFHGQAQYTTQPLQNPNPVYMGNNASHGGSNPSLQAHPTQNHPHALYNRYNSNYESSNPSWHAHGVNSGPEHPATASTSWSVAGPSPPTYSFAQPQHQGLPLLPPRPPLSPPPSYSSIQSPAIGPSSLNASMSTLNLQTSCEPQDLDVFAQGTPHEGNDTLDDPMQQLMSTKLDAIITSMDEEMFSGNEQDLETEDISHDSHELPESGETTRRLAPGGRFNAFIRPARTARTNHFAKVWMYQNSRLPPHLQPLKVYMPTWPLLTLAAHYSERAYTPALQRQEREMRIAPNWRSGAKAMVLKSVAVDDINTIVLAIRGSQTFSDWTVNFRQEPASPEAFLDDAGNLCHSGFLSVAKSMLRSTASHLENILSTHYTNSASNVSSRHKPPSLLLTGHSAGGAVAQLLYAHLASSTAVTSPLKSLLSRFKRVHCITFGAPPVSLLPLQAPGTSADKVWVKSLFFSFVNEGDPVARADPAIIKSLLRLYVSPAPAVSVAGNAVVPRPGHSGQPPKSSKPLRGRPAKAGSWPAGRPGNAASVPRPTWAVPECAMSLAGRVVLLRTQRQPSQEERRGHKTKGTVEACVVSDEQLRGVVFGDPMCHMMRLYTRRVEELATRAVLVRENG